MAHVYRATVLAVTHTATLANMLPRHYRPMPTTMPLELLSGVCLLVGHALWSASLCCVCVCVFVCVCVSSRSV